MTCGADSLLVASHACGADSAAFGRWLLAAGRSDPEALLAAGTAERAGVRPRVVDRYRHGLASPSSLAPLPPGWEPVSLLDNRYPPLLRTLDDAPGVLFVHGATELLQAPQVAMVGARRASAEGLAHATRFARDLACAGIVITSGLALGIDAASHAGALQTGRTLAVLGHGPGPVHPPRNRGLAARILAGGGALVSEFPPGLGPRPEHFPSRNRVIAGLCLATVVIEAAPRSGSLITARLAAQQGREVFAVPGSILNPLSRGCHQLLRDGAGWLESTDDLLDAFPAWRQLAAAADDTGPQSGAPDGQDLLRHFTHGVNTMDDLVERSGMDVAELSRRLLELELKGRVGRLPGGFSRLA